MKTKVIFLQCMILSVFVFGQNKGQQSLFEIEVIPPRFPVTEMIWAGEKIESIDDYLEKNIEYPEKAVRFGYQGTEVIQFDVTPAGELTNINVINSICKEVDKEVIRILRTTSGMWRPAYINSEPVTMTKEVSLVFRLNKNEDFVAIAKKYANQGNRKLFVNKDPKKALRFYNKGLTLLPNEECLLTMSGICKFELGDEKGAHRDWSRINTLSGADKNYFGYNHLTNDFRKLKGYDTFIQTTLK